MQRKQMIRPSSVLCLEHKNDGCGICTIHINENYVFVQYYDVVPEEAVPVDGVDEKLICIRFKWDQHEESEHER